MMLKPIMSRGGLIEIMACMVAGFGRRAFQGDGKANQYLPEVIDEYFGGFEKDPVALVKQGDGTFVAGRLSGDRLENFMRAMRDRKVQYMSPEENGLEFCLTLARTTGCTVRASRLTQCEENGDLYGTFGIEEMPHIIMRDFDRFGEWEGPVWDFTPNGRVTYLGCNLPRARLRFPVHRVGPQLTHNFRQQGGQSSSGGQRPQRMNRSPLPV
jgi:hypothetical protein